jgi:hypothetical protein
VDWVAIDGFNWGTTQGWSKWTSISKMVSWGLYHDYHGRKPMMIAETGSVEQGGNKAAWISGAAQTLKSNYPAIAAFVYYNEEDRSQPVSWCANSSSAAMSAIRAISRFEHSANSGIRRSAARLSERLSTSRFSHPYAKIVRPCVSSSARESRPGAVDVTSPG